MTCLLSILACRAVEKHLVVGVLSPELDLVRLGQVAKAVTPGEEDGGSVLGPFVVGQDPTELGEVGVLRPWVPVMGQRNSRERGIPATTGLAVVLVGDLVFDLVGARDDPRDSRPQG